VNPSYLVPLGFSCTCSGSEPGDLLLLPLLRNLSCCKLEHTQHHNRFTALFWDHPGEPAPEENFWTLCCKGRLTEADTPTIRLGATPSGLSSAHLHQTPHIFYRPDALPAAQPTASKH